MLLTSWIILIITMAHPSHAPLLAPQTGTWEAFGSGAEQELEKMVQTAQYAVHYRPQQLTMGWVYLCDTYARALDLTLVRERV